MRLMQFPSLVTDIGADGTVLVPFVTLEVARPCSTPYIGANFAWTSDGHPGAVELYFFRT